MTTDQHAAEDRATAIRIVRDTVQPGQRVGVDALIALEYRIKTALARARRETRDQAIASTKRLAVEAARHDQDWAAAEGIARVEAALRAQAGQP